VKGRRRLGLLALLAAAGAACISAGLFPQEPLRAFLEARLRRSFGPSSRVGRLHVVPGRLWAEIEDLAVTGPDLSFTARRLTLSVAPSLLFGGAPTLRRLTIESPRLVINASGGGASGAGRLPVIVEDVRITGGTIVYTDPSLGGRVTLPGVDVTGSLGMGSLSVTTGEGIWAREPAVAVGPIRGHVRITPLLSIALDTLVARSGPSWFRARGTLGHVGALAPRLDLEAEANLEMLSRSFALAPSHGVLRATGRLEGQGASLHATAVVQGKSLVVGSWPVDSIKTELAYDRGGPRRATVSVGARVLGGALDGRASLDGSKIEAHVTARGIDLDRATRAAGVGVGPGAIAGQASGDLRLRGDVDGVVQARAHWDASPRMERFAGSGSGDVEGALWPRRKTSDLTWNVALDGSAVGPGPRLRTVRASASGTARGTWPLDVNGTMQGDAGVETAGGLRHVAMDATIAMQGGTGTFGLDARGLGGPLHADATVHGDALERLSVSGEALDLSLLESAAKGALSFRLSARGPLKHIEATGSASAEGLEWSGVTAGAATAQLDASHGRGRVTLSFPHLSLLGEIIAPLDGHGPIEGTFEANDSPLAPFGPLIPSKAPLAGSLRARLKFEAPLADPAALHASANVERLSVSSGAFTADSQQPFSLEVAHRRIAISGMSLRGPGYNLSVGGSLGMDARDEVALDLTVSGDGASLPLPEAWNLQGRVQGQVKVSGSRAAPRLSGAIEARGLEVGGPSIPPFSATTLRLDLEGDRVTVAPTDVVVANGKATLSATLPLASFTAAKADDAACATASLQVGWQGVEVSKLLAVVATPDTANIKASLTGNVDLEGCPTAPQTLRGSLHLDDAVLQSGDLSVNLSPVDVRLDAGRLSTAGITVWTQEGSLEIGGAVDLVSRQIDVNADGRLALRALSPLVGTVAFSGNADVSLAIAGSFANPRPTGSIWMRDAAIRMRDIPDALTGLNGTLVVDGTALRLEGTRATLGGGEILATGGARLRGAALSDVDVKITGSDLALRYPVGLRSRVKADLALTGRSGALRLAGTVRLLRGLYDLDLAVEQGGSTPVASPTPSPLLRSVDLAVGVELDSPVLIRNRLASLGVTGSLRFQGNMETPSPLGRLGFQENGRIYLQGREFSVQSGGLVYEGDWNPTVSLRATAHIRDTGKNDVNQYKDYDVELVADGRLDTVQPRIQASGLSNAQALALVATGSTSGAGLGTGARVAGGEAASLLVGRFSTGLGLDQVSVQPELLARETDPGTRFTFGKQLSSAVSLIYSLGLSGPEERFTQLNVEPYRGVSLIAQRRDDGVFTVGAGQRLRFGGPRRSRSSPGEERVRIESVRLEGDLPLPEAELRSTLKARAGKEVTSWSIQDDADRLRSRLVNDSYIEAEVGGRLEGQVAVFRIHAGPRFDWKVTGMPDPPDLGKTIRKALFEEDALDRGRAKLLDRLRSRGFPRARIDAHGVDEERGRTLLFEVDAGDKVRATVLFPGARVLSSNDLLHAAGGAGELLTAPEPALKRIRDAYRAHERLEAMAGPVSVEEAPGHVIVHVPIDEGPGARIASVRFDGAAALSEVDLRAAARLTPGTPYVETAPAAAADRVRQRYLGLGFPHVRVVPEAKQEGADVDLVLHVEEGEQIRVGTISIVGLGKTREGLVRGRLHLTPGEPLDPRRLVTAERRLLELGIFSQALVTASDDNPADITIRLEERAPIAASYDVRYNDRDKTTGLLDAEVRNLFGVGLTTGGRYRVGADIREARGSAFLPSLFGAGSLTASAFHEEEDLGVVTDPVTEDVFTNVQVRRGFQVQQSVPLAGQWHGLFGYGFTRSSRTVFPEPIDDAGIDVALIRDTRDNPLDAHRGRFLNLTVTYSPKVLGSDITFIEGFAQAFFVRSLGESWLWAQGYRIGLAKGFGGQSVYTDNLFKAGGANSLRGYATDAVGPNYRGDALGGEAVVILNEEVRRRLVGPVGIALFYDVGNVFPTVKTMSFDLKHTLGLGLRWPSPIGLLRVDLGFPLNPEAGTEDRPADAHRQIFFSLGQAF
jgi:outer membrane protein assembly factor BamA/autotransporter translocation and assembly factor TamB